MNKISPLVPSLRSNIAGILVLVFMLPGLAQGQGKLVSWGVEPGTALTPAPVIKNTPIGKRFVQVSAGRLHAVALRDDGRVRSWGVMNGGSLNYGQVTKSPSDADYKQVAAGFFHSLALRNDGSIVLWGSTYGAPVLASPPIGTGFIQIDTGGLYSIGLHSDGSIATWGPDDFAGILSDTPTGNEFIQVAAGDLHFLALRRDGTIVGWGLDSLGQATGGPKEGGFKQIAAGDKKSLALRKDGSIASWGDDFFGLAIPAPTEKGFLQLSATDTHVLGLRSDHSIAIWGFVFQSPVSDIPLGGRFNQLAAGFGYSIAVRNSTIVVQPTVDNGGPGGSSLVISGDSLRSGQSADLQLQGAAPNSRGWLVIGTRMGGSAFFGGNLVPTGATKLVQFQTDSNGSFAMPRIAGGGGPHTAFVQAVYLDGDLAGGVGLSNTLAVEWLP